MPQKLTITERTWYSIRVDATNFRDFPMDREQMRTKALIVWDVL
jgi:hypothetical protein